MDTFLEIAAKAFILCGLAGLVVVFSRPDVGAAMIAGGMIAFATLVVITT